LQPVKLMPATLERLKILINSSTPIVLMETVEEMRAVGLVRAASAELNMAVFEWSIADGLVRSGSGTPAAPNISLHNRVESRVGTPGGGSESDRLANAVLSALGSDAAAAAKPAIYNTREPVQALANMESMTVEAVFILKDFHRHLEDPVVVRRLRDVGQKFSINRRTVILTAPSITLPPELGSLVEYIRMCSGCVRSSMKRSSAYRRLTHYSSKRTPPLSMSSPLIFAA
jgi:hypothetical protein